MKKRSRKPTKPTSDKMEMASFFPQEGNTRAKQNAAFLGIGVSTFWKYVKEQRIKKPIKFNDRISVWDAKYIRDLQQNGIPKASMQEQ